MSWLEVVFYAGLWVAVPWTGELAVVTAEYAVAHKGANVYGNGTFMFNGQVSDAFVGVQHVGFGKSIGGADVHASCAAAAVIFVVRFVRG